MSTVHDEAYWARYYESGSAPEEPSLFAKYVMDRYAETGQSLLELGCGNGRDARFFATNGIGVVAVDMCEPEVETLIRRNGHQPNLTYVADDFTDLPDTNNDGYDLVYSRFTLHSVSAEGQKRTIDWSYRNLKPGGKICVETRGQRNELYKRGEPVEGEQDAYIYEGHYRRFVEFNRFISDIMASQFKILEATEDTGFAPYIDTDYHFIRVIAQK